MEAIDKDRFFTALHDSVGICSHCGKRSCAGKRSGSKLPASIATDVIIAAADGATADQAALRRAIAPSAPTPAFVAFAEDLIAHNLNEPFPMPAGVVRNMLSGARHFEIHTARRAGQPVDLDKYDDAIDAAIAKLTAEGL